MSIPAPVQELIDGSGNNFHSKVARWFSSNDWRVAVSPYYMDQTQQKARELDLVAERSWPVKDGFGRWEGEVVVRLFVECKFVSGHSVFWFTNKNQVAVEELVCSSGGFRKDNSYTAQHHYLASGNRVAKVFASTNARGQEAEPFYKALNQALNGLVSLRVQPTSAATSSRGADRVLAILDYPIVVCSSFAFLYAADFDGQHEPSEIRDNFQLEVQYAYVDPSGRTNDNLFVLDFVEYEKLSQFIASIQRDAEIAGYLSSSGL